MNARTITGAALLAGALLVGVVRVVRAAGAAGAAVDQEAGERAFGELARVFLSPRCRNCHTAGDAPLQGEDRPAPHAMNISRRTTSAGLQCTGCHRDTNSTQRGGPPGAPDWHMTSALEPMAFEGRTPHELCLQLRDPGKTGGRTLDAVREHLRTDPLVLWAWSPGPGRTKPPMSHAEMMNDMRAWTDAGAPCPR